jgi:DNA replication and repair protein RecF
MFHVKPLYLQTLRQYLRAVKQRNTLLKDHADPKTLKPWHEEVARLGESVTADRLWYLDLLAPYFQRALADLAPELNVEVRYQRGWGRDEELGKLLGDSSPREVKYASTLWGPHRADVQLRADGAAAGATLSRGQGKLVASAMQIAQAALLAESEKRTTVFLIDDAGAELDVAHNERFFSLLQRLGGQILATTTRTPELRQGAAASERGSRVFHVKQGAVEPSNEHSDPNPNDSSTEQETE